MQTQASLAAGKCRLAKRTFECKHVRIMPQTKQGTLTLSISALIESGVATAPSHSSIWGIAA